MTLQPFILGQCGRFHGKLNRFGKTICRGSVFIDSKMSTKGQSSIKEIRFPFSELLTAC